MSHRLADRRLASLALAIAGATAVVGPAAALADPARESSSTVRTIGSHAPLQPLSPDDLTRAKVRGEGCTFLVGLRRTMLVSMSGRRGVAKVRGRLVPLLPAEGASDLFPGTFDRWRGSGLELRVGERSGDAAVARESIVTPATLEIVGEKRVRHVAGLLDCGW